MSCQRAKNGTDRVRHLPTGGDYANYDPGIAPIAAHADNHVDCFGALYPHADSEGIDWVRDAVGMRI